jgi:hypothetical protein
MLGILGIFVGNFGQRNAHLVVFPKMKEGRKLGKKPWPKCFCVKIRG